MYKEDRHGIKSIFYLLKKKGGEVSTMSDFSLENQQSKQKQPDLVSVGTLLTLKESQAGPATGGWVTANGGPVPRVWDQSRPSGEYNTRHLAKLRPIL